VSLRKNQLMDDVDRHVGQRLRRRRIMLGLTQHDLAARLGVTYQQFHKYEQGINRMAASRLYEVAGLLHTPINYFFEHFGDPAEAERTPRERMALELSRAFNEINEPEHQNALMELARVLAEGVEPDGRGRRGN
jgi:transcriptional regulator with XRE-family HTH domain